MTTAPVIHNDVEKCVDAIIEKIGKDIKFGMPLGLGKPVHLVNALYKRAKADPSIKLVIATALSLEKPAAAPGLESKFMGPFVERLFGDIPDLEYMVDLRKKALPPNVEVTEFFFKAGAFLKDDKQQQNYICTNYTHAVRELVALGVNAVSQIVAKKEINGVPRYSLSSNPDTSLDLVPILREQEKKGRKIAVIAEVNNNLPFMVNHAEVGEDEFDLILENPVYEYPLFGAPNMAIMPADHMIGFNASTLLRDNGTLQVGIGSLGSALVYSAILRHKNNALYNEIMDDLKLEERFPVISELGGRGTFEKGLYGCSEMMVDGFMHLYKAGILKREVFDNVDIQTLLNEEKITQNVSLSTLDALVEQGVLPTTLRAKDIEFLKQYGIFKRSVDMKGGCLLAGDQTIDPTLEDDNNRALIAEHCLGDKLKGGIVMHGGFFIGPKDFYQDLRDLTPEENEKFCMTSVKYINHLFDHEFGDQKLKVAQRQDARFINSTMMYTLGGAAVSDGLENGKVVSGVGGQYNFVAMAHEIDDARSILNLKSYRTTPSGPKSNIMMSYGHCTIPRHLRDIVVTEYGVADLLSKNDQEVYIELIKISDSRFQDELLSEAKAAGKVAKDYQLPDIYRHNTPEKLLATYNKYKAKGLFDPFPFGCDFTQEELQIGKALKGLKAKTATRSGLLKCMWEAIKINMVPEEFSHLMDRMDMSDPSNFKAKLEQKLLVSELIAQKT
ncbi:acetyl-CoA hydrolase/transferase C-terminal domain-containing protein [Alkalimarinus alittae]|uniref:Acetyl-CoA hydrolase n=1 Tax=Alkalimarinus alittae TaxID=2961619 RepID=A0ABY6MZJ6_9ALTE|nr:acetyl-CoA hydrolase/transferase C-terminal domain-containing protein [Alkalimarinus alittae]UZE95263.1 acetyl-CoA hydrolase [Alkalimarinus alittae]